jgi:predicted phage baseplate assembly protein
LIDSAQGLSQVTNPLSTSGGADPDTVPDTRINGPASVRAFNRAVSEADYAALALTFPGISKATASMVTQDANGNSLAQPYVQLTIATNNDSVAGQSSGDQALVVQLRQFLDQRRDPNIPLRVATFTPVYLDLYLTVDLLSTYPRQATLGVVQSVLNPGANSDGSFGYFSFQQLNFGQSLYLAAIYALVQNIPGVSDLTITRFQPTNMLVGSATITPSDIAIGPTQIAAIGNDPSNPQYGQLIITPGTGGFADS